MLQRIQSILLLVAAVANLMVIFVPSFSIEAESGGKNAELSFVGTDIIYSGDSDVLLKKMDSSWEPKVFMGLAVLSVALIFFIILKYKNRKIQVSLSRIAIAIIFIQLMTEVLLVSELQEVFSEGLKTTWNPKLGFGLPFFAIIMLTMAGKYIQKDEKLVRSADSIR